MSLGNTNINAVCHVSIYIYVHMCVQFYEELLFWVLLSGIIIIYH